MPGLRDHMKLSKFSLISISEHATDILIEPLKVMSERIASLIWNVMKMGEFKYIMNWPSAERWLRIGLTRSRFDRFRTNSNYLKSTDILPHSPYCPSRRLYLAASDNTCPKLHPEQILWYPLSICLSIHNSEGSHLYFHEDCNPACHLQWGTVHISGPWRQSYTHKNDVLDKWSSRSGCTLLFGLNGWNHWVGNSYLTGCLTI